MFSGSHEGNLDSLNVPENKWCCLEKKVINVKNI